MHLSKSKYCLLSQCPKLLWLDKYHRELRTEDPSLEERMITGNQVGDLAMGLFGDFTEVTVLDADSKPDISAMLEKSRQLSSKNPDFVLRNILHNNFKNIAKSTRHFGGCFFVIYIPRDFCFEYSHQRVFYLCKEAQD